MKIHKTVLTRSLAILILTSLIATVNVAGDRIVLKDIEHYNKSLIIHNENLVAKSRSKRFLIFNNGGLVKVSLK